MGYQYQPKNEQTLNQSLKVQELAISGADKGMFTITTPAVLGPSLGEAEKYAVLAGSTVTNTGASVVTGELGVSPGTAVTGFPPGTVVNGSIHSNDASAIQAQLDVTAAYNDLAARTPNQNLSGQDLGTLVLGPGVYKFNTSAALTGTLVLDAQGNPDALFIFQIGSTLTTAAASVVSLINGALPGNVYWQVGSSATLGTTSTFKGDILALTAITVTTGANIAGRALARNAAVTLDTNAVLKVNSGQLGSAIVMIREPLDKVYMARLKNDTLNAWTEYPSSSISIVDSVSFTTAAPSDRGAVKIVGLSALAVNDVVIVKYLARPR